MSTEKISIWNASPSIKEIEWMKKNTLSQSLGIEITEIGNDFIKGTMPVDERTKQPFGICHGGAYVALAEELGSIASWLVVDGQNFIGVGVEINANHLKAVRSGIVTAICKPVHIKGRTHVWEIKITDDAGDLCCISRFTCAIVAKNKIM
ncbi:MAG: hotdog fold thioesterase [Bacteroidia bacterium]|nr:hotdog fold thioesterase [Bacteroidia bacterium]